jgi:hypothetical protein
MWKFDRSDDDRDIGWGEDSPYDDDQDDGRPDGGRADRPDQPDPADDRSGADPAGLRWLRAERPPHHLDADCP